MLKLLIPALLLVSCYRHSTDEEPVDAIELVPSVIIDGEPVPQTRKSSTPQTVVTLGEAGEGSDLTTNETPDLTVVTPSLPIELPETEMPDNSDNPSPSADQPTIVQSLVCTGRGEPALAFSSRIDFYSDNSRIYHFSLWNRESVIENFEAYEAPGALNDFSLTEATIGSPVSSKVQHGFEQGYREYLGYSVDANLYQQLFLIDDRGGLELRVGQTGDNEHPEFFGLDAARCVKL